MGADFLYFIVILVILLNIVFGIIIDTFSQLRSEKVGGQPTRWRRLAVAVS
jgi:hypothetical protein